MKINLIILATAIMLILSCKKNSTTTPATSNVATNIVNRWYITADSVKQIVNGITYPAGSSLYGGGDGVLSLIFNGDGTGWDYSFLTTARFNYTINGNSINFSYVGALPNSPPTIVQATIQSSSANKLILVFTTTSPYVVYGQITITNTFKYFVTK